MKQSVSAATLVSGLASNLVSVKLTTRSQSFGHPRKSAKKNQGERDVPKALPLRAHERAERGRGRAGGGDPCRAEASDQPAGEDAWPEHGGRAPLDHGGGDAGRSRSRRASSRPACSSRSGLFFRPRSVGRGCPARGTLLPGPGHSCLNYTEPSPTVIPRNP